MLFRAAKHYVYRQHLTVVSFQFSKSCLSSELLWTSSSRLEMGRKKRNNRRQQNREDGGGKTKGAWTGGKAGAGYSNITMENPAFEKYYQEQSLVPEGEWDTFMATIKTPLPVTFRITGFRGQANQVLRYLKSECFNKILQSNSEEASESKPIPIPWYPDDLAWQLNLSRKNIRKLPALEKLHLFLISETESGNISRQEIVSMIPPLLLQVKPHHRVLDMCAAPGSKTAQLIEMVHAEQTMGWPEGFVIGNDDDNKRCYIMVHQAKRLNSPCCMVVNHDASVFPRLRVPGPDGQMTNIEYDRILCDVPCGGDGTMRKNYAIWKKWTPLSGFNLHPLQRRILLRGIELLAVGGRLVYSTCSFNPVENEAVIASVLKQSEGAIELVDMSNELVGLKRQPGKSTWKVIDDKGQVFTSLDDVNEREEKDKRRRYKPSFWPPAEEEAKTLKLHRCVRILPHHQNTGGFFVAVLQKTRTLPWMKQDSKNGATAEQTTEQAAEGSTGSPPPTAEGEGEAKPGDGGEGTKPGEGDEAMTSNPQKKAAEATKSPSGPPAKKPRFGGFKEDPFVFFKEEEDVWPPIREFYDVDDSFPVTQLLTRCHVGKKRNLYLTNKLIKDILQNNEDRLKVINSGVRVWSRSDAHDVSCDFRLTQEGINVLYPYLRERKITVTREDVITLFSEEAPFTKNFSEGIRETLDNIGMGAVILTYQPASQEGEQPDSPFVLVAWRGKTSLRSYIAKGDRQHILRMVGAPIADTKRIRPYLMAQEGEAGASAAMETGEADGGVDEEETMAGGEEDGGEGDGNEDGLVDGGDQDGDDEVTQAKPGDGEEV